MLMLQTDTISSLLTKNMSVFNEQAFMQNIVNIKLCSISVDDQVICCCPEFPRLVINKVFSCSFVVSYQGLNPCSLCLPHFPAPRYSKFYASTVTKCVLLLCEAHLYCVICSPNWCPAACLYYPSIP